MKINKKIYSHRRRRILTIIVILTETKRKMNERIEREKLCTLVILSGFINSFLCIDPNGRGIGLARGHAKDSSDKP